MSTSKPSIFYPYFTDDILLPVGLHIVIKYWQCQLKDKKEVWKAAQTKNEAFRDLLYQAHQNAIPFRYVLADSWYTNAENICWLQFAKLERLKLAEGSNQFALKGRLYIRAIQAALAELRLMQQNNLLANILPA